MSVAIADLDTLVELAQNLMRSKLAYKRAREDGDPLLFIAYAQWRADGKALMKFMGPTDMAKYVEIA